MCLCISFNFKIVPPSPIPLPLGVVLSLLLQVSSAVPTSNLMFPTNFLLLNHRPSLNLSSDFYMISNSSSERVSLEPIALNTVIFFIGLQFLQYYVASLA